jgi:hypothetical protein
VTRTKAIGEGEGAPGLESSEGLKTGAAQGGTFRGHRLLHECDEGAVTGASGESQRPCVRAGWTRYLACLNMVLAIDFRVV